MAEKSRPKARCHKIGSYTPQLCSSLIDQYRFQRASRFAGLFRGLIFSNYFEALISQRLQLARDTTSLNVRKCSIPISQ
jgi:hypothetical protein